MPKMEGIFWNELDPHDLVEYSDAITLCHITCASQNCDYKSPVVSSLIKELMRYSDIKHSEMTLHTALHVSEVEAPLKTEKSENFFRESAAFSDLNVQY